MGYKGDKKRPGRDAERERLARWVTIQSTSKTFHVHVDTQTGDIVAVGDESEIASPERNRITSAVLATLLRHQWVADDPLQIRDLLFADIESRHNSKKTPATVLTRC